MRFALLFPLVLSVGCKRTPVEAPDDIDELSRFLFLHFEDTEDTAELEAGILELRAFLQDQDYSLGNNPKDSIEERAVTLSPIDGEWLGELSIPDGADAEAQVPIAIPHKSVHPIEDQPETMVEENQVCIESGTTVWAGRDFIDNTNPDCFADGDCNQLAALTEVRKESLLAKVWYDQYKDYRRILLEDEEGNEIEAIIARSWTEEVFPADGGTNSWDQLFQLDVFIEEGDETLRWFAMWSSVTLGGIGDDAYAGLVKGGIAEAYIYGDEFISGNIETCNNDRGAEKPERESR